ncbi:hypothetical protein [Marinicrinis sediminis]|uniref:Uncharacterized protein n=1 Tax=Marinicrinis sediminis TaxID=1652465 RepID=A0ABW5RE21_9BACL
MEKITPENFRELLSAISIILGFVFSFISLKGTLKEHSLRLAGLLLLLGLCLFANNAWCYFAAIFIIATAVTQLDFLQNLAAIIRGNKDYFDYRKEFISKDEILENKTKEIEKDKMEVIPEAPELGDSNKEAGSEEKKGNDTKEQTTINLELKKNNLNPVHFALIAEELVFKDIEKKFQKQVQRHIRIVGRPATMVLDGLLELDTRDIIFEIKVFRQSPFPLAVIKRSINEIMNLVLEYQSLIKKNKEVHLTYVVVSSFEKETKEILDERLSKVISDVNLFNIKVDYIYYSFHDLGLENTIVNK